ncbi:MAG: hypothetical protein EPO24_02195 [Bacteroidetes bacterium]|nr:MAG: hypothetical protein EPO24_02195 [Bacteroidota bacterium]
MAKRKDETFDDILRRETSALTKSDSKPIDVFAVVSAANPSNFIDIVKLNGDAIEAKRKANELVIQTDAHEQVAADLLRQIKDYGKESEEIRKLKVGPFNELVKRINGIFKPVTENLETAENIIKGKVLAFRQYKEKLRQDEERKRQEEYNKQVEAAKSNTKANVIVPAPPPILIPENKTSGNMGSISTRKVWRFRVVDITKVPHEFLRVDETLVNARIRNLTGNRIDPVGKIPGLEIYQEDTIASGRS